MPTRPLRTAIAQLNVVVGDLQNNRHRLIAAATEAVEQQADILLTPELALTGYPPEDLLLRPTFLKQCAVELAALCHQTQFMKLHLVVGHPVLINGECFNALSVIYQGQVVAQYRKSILPNNRVFDEKRYFCVGHQPCVFKLNEVSVGVVICEDIWHSHPAQQARAAGTDILLVANASPFHRGKTPERWDMVRQRIQETGLSVVYANLVGGQDELVFDGASFAMNGLGEVTASLPQFVECVTTVEVVLGASPSPRVNEVASLCAPEQEVYEALCLGVRDYVNKNHFPGAIIGLSGGVDSALTLAIAVDALGKERVRAVMMPSPYTAEISLTDSRAMVANLGVVYDEMPIEPCMQAFEQTLAPFFQNLPLDTTEENIQARIRGVLLMALSNKTGAVVLTTGNKSEFATGYCTLYGDMAGGFAVIKDIFKTWVYRLCHYRNGLQAVIPERILTRAPTAELRPNQLDQDNLPPYDILDAILARYMENDESLESLLEAGFDPNHVAKTIKLLRLSEYKRRQAPVGIRVTHRAFGRDWRYPITSHFFDA